MTDSFDPAEALAAATGARRRLAARPLSPWWYAPLYGLGMGGMIASFALPGATVLIGTSLGMGLVLVTYAVWKAKTGIAVSGMRRGRTMPLTLGLLVALIALMFVAVRFGRESGETWVVLACAAGAAVLSALASRAWDRTWRAEMTETL